MWFGYFVVAEFSMGDQIVRNQFEWWFVGDYNSLFGQLENNKRRRISSQSNSKCLINFVPRCCSDLMVLINCYCEIKRMSWGYVKIFSGLLFKWPTCSGGRLGKSRVN